MARRGLGVTITPDLLNDFFTIKPKSKQTDQRNKYSRHHVGSSHSVTHANSGGVSPHLAFDEGQYFEQQLKLGSPYDIDEDPFSFPKAPVPVNELLLPEPEDVSPEPANQEVSIEVYDNYLFEHEYESTLPITDERQLVLQTIEANRVTVIQGSTGSGKTTQVPQYILDHYQQRRKYCNVLVTQPRRIAAMSVAKRVSQERNWQIGTLVGYQVARERKLSEDTRITYMTTGVLLQKLIKNKNLADYTHIVLDEVHERDQDIDFSMLVVRKYLQTVSRHVKVILMSATVDSSLFSNYFSIPINGRPEGAPVISVDGKMYDVAEYYFEDIAGLSEPPQQTIYEPEISEKCYRLCRELIQQLDKDELGDRYRPGLLAERRGTVLCFLPGLPEITTMHTFLADLEEKLRFKFMPLHSQITSSEQQKVFNPAMLYERKIILSTNIAESSITVPDIKYVIDFCLVKNNETDRDTNYQRLMLQWASKASLTQRKGRAGRVSEGHCFRMISSSFYNQLTDYCIPEMLRSPLEQVVLKVKLLELGHPASVLRLALQPPDLTDIKRTILMLKEVGALTVRQNGHINSLDGDLTFVGRVLGSLPVDVHIGKLLLIGYTFGVLEECLVIGACLSLKSIFSKPFRNDLKAYANKMHWSDYSSSDLLASFRAYLSWKFRKENTGFGEPEKQWAQKNSLEHKRFYEVDELAKELRGRLQQFNIHTHKDIFKRNELSKDDQLMLKLVIAGAFYPNYFETQEVDETEATKTMSGQNPFTTVVVHGAPPTLCHYRSRVAQLFRQCGRGKRMYFENSRAYIEFENDENKDSPVATAVYNALKMRHLRIPLNIHVSKKKDDAYRTTLAKKPLESMNPETGLRTNRVNAGLDRNAKISVTMEGNPKQVKLETDGYIQLFIQEIVNVGHFWATYAFEENCQIMNQLHSKINILAGRNLKPLQPSNVKVGGYCLAAFEDEFFRAEITSCSTTYIKVKFLDYGNSATLLDKSHIRECPDSLLVTPFQAFECYLSEIRPIRGTWDEGAMRQFMDLAPLGACKLTGKIYSQVHGTYRLELYNGDLNINRSLIEEGFATYAEEPLPSKSRHEEIQKLKLLGMKPPSQASDTFVTDASEIEHGEEVLKITLRGPFSPFEVSFCGLTASGRLRSCRVEQDSVNSVVICEEPQDNYSRLLVAATININTSGNTMIARETTLLPNIHGFTSLIPLLFAPVAELRCDKKGTQLTGALCGLGFDDTGAAILPDHDIEVAFDIKFTLDDLRLVNTVRYLINTAIGIEEERVEHAPKKVSYIQDSAREKLLQLTTEVKRDDAEVQAYRREYQWNQLSTDMQLDCGYEEKPYFLYTYHKGIYFYEKETIDPRIVEQRQQLEQLHSMAGNSLMPFRTEVICPSCQVRCRHPRGLSLHIETPQHRNWFHEIFKSP